jgi:hypothetical protein
MKAADKQVLDKRSFDMQSLKMLNDSSQNLYNEEEYLLSPWRFAKGGWRYVKRNAVDPYLNHPNKANSIGFVNYVGKS